MRRRLLAAVVAFILSGPVFAHDPYSDWRNKRGNDCCHGQDCAALKFEDIEADKQSGTVLRIKVRGQWCPVAEWMTLARGKSPDWSADHACIRKNAVFSNPCDALICFAGKPQF